MVEKTIAARPSFAPIMKNLADAKAADTIKLGPGDSVVLDSAVLDKSSKAGESPRAGKVKYSWFADRFSKSKGKDPQPTAGSTTTPNEAIKTFLNVRFGEAAQNQVKNILHEDFQRAREKYVTSLGADKSSLKFDEDGDIEDYPGSLSYAAEKDFLDNAAADVRDAAIMLSTIHLGAGDDSKVTVGALKTLIGKVDEEIASRAKDFGRGIHERGAWIAVETLVAPLVSDGAKTHADLGAGPRSEVRISRHDLNKAAAALENFGAGLPKPVTVHSDLGAVADALNKVDLSPRPDPLVSLDDLNVAAAAIRNFR